MVSTTKNSGDVWLCGDMPVALKDALQSAGLALTGNGESTSLQAMVYCAPMTANETGGQHIVAHVSAVLEDFAASARVAAKTLAAKGGGQIVVVCDIVAHCGRAGHPARSAADAALLGASKCLAKELGRHKVDVNVICHGAQPELGSTLELSGSERKLFDMMGLGAPGTPAMLASNIAHMARGGHGMTGQVLNVDNGMVM